MLRFKVYENGKPAKSMNLDGAHLLSADRVPLRAELRFTNGEIVCEPRSRGAAAIALMYPVKGRGRMMLETTRLLDRKEPYNLHIELARGQLMRISLKREDWGMYGFADGQTVYDLIDEAKKLLVDAMTAPDDLEAAELGDAAIAKSIDAGEAMSRFHAEVMLERPASPNNLARRPIGCRVTTLGPQPASPSVLKAYAQRFNEGFDFAAVPFSWRLLEPEEGNENPAPYDEFIHAMRQTRTPLWGKALVSFDERQMPQWLNKYEGNFEEVRARVVKRIKYVLKHFGMHIRAWEIVSGIHACNPLKFTFEQLMDLTRTAAMLVKQLSPRSKVIIGITQPWGEYYAGDPRSIPPYLYAEMAVETGISFDAIGLDLQFGGKESRLYTRDLMQCSSIIDQFAGLGKSIHISAAGTPSGGEPGELGSWREAWTEEVQAEWLRDFLKISLSKPFVETVCLTSLRDAPSGGHCDGVLHGDFSIKPAFRELVKFRKELRSRRDNVI